MFESATDRRHYDAIRKAHTERAAAFAGLWSAMFPRRR